MSEEFIIQEYRKRMDGALGALKSELSGLRTGRVNASLLDNIKVEVYGTLLPLNQVGSISVPEPRMLSVSVWDKSQIAAVDKALRKSSLGLNPIMDGQILRIPVPSLTEERRQVLVKVAGNYSENTRIAVRNIRRDAMDKLKRMEKEALMSQDEQKAHSDDVQDMTDSVIEVIDGILQSKTEEIMRI